MKKKHYLANSVGDLVESKYGKDKLFRVIHSVALRTSEVPLSFSLNASELFYQVLFSIDTLVEYMEEYKNNAILYARDLWLELVVQFGKDEEIEEKDIHFAATLVVLLTENLLYIGRKGYFFDVCEELSFSVSQKDGEHKGIIDKILLDIMYEEMTFDNIQTWMKNYLSSNLTLSDEIGDMIEMEQTRLGSEGLSQVDQMAEELKVFFWGNAEESHQFVTKILHHSDREIVQMLGEMVSRNKISRNSKKVLWEILHRYEIYHAKYQNFSNQLKKSGW